MLAEPSTTAATIPTRHVHLISLDPLDDNYFASSGPASDNVVSVWDRRKLPSSTNVTIASTATSAALEIRSVLPPSLHPPVWSLRYSGFRRGAFGVLSAGGTVRYLETNASSTSESSLSTMYVSRTHDMNTLSDMSPITNVPRVIAFDHASPGSLGKRDTILTLTQDRQTRVLDVPTVPFSAEFSSINEVAFNTYETTFTCSGAMTHRPSFTSSQGKFQILNERTQMTGDLANLSSRDRHERFLNLKLDPSTPSLALALTTMDLQRQRCLKGYLFDCDKNMSIVKEDPWLVELWETVRRLNRMASNRGMMHGGLDMSFYGVHDIWFANFEGRGHRLRRTAPSQDEFSRLIKQILASQSYGEFEGVETKFPERRQLALAICGYKFDEKRLREKCTDIISRHEFYKAIIVAVVHGRKDIAIDLLKSLTRTKSIDNSGLAAVIACSTISEEQRSLCDWMAEEAEDPYLKALLAYFISGTWSTVVEMVELPLQYRVAVALKYLDDGQLSSFFSNSIQEVVEAGDTEGIVLTGLTEWAAILFQNYITRYQDLQTAVLAMGLTSPHLVKDGHWDMWKTVYFDQAQAWSAFLERARFINQHNRIVENHRVITKPGPSRTSSEKNNAQLRCTSCLKPTARPPGAKPKSTQDKILSPDGTVCQQCGQHFSRCAICLHWQGSARGKQPAPSESNLDTGFMTALIGFCVACKHSFHVSHAKEWFAQHARCPVPECQCSCNLGQGLPKR